jgi:hypothetical protein
LPLSENSNAIDYVLPDYNEIKQGYVQPLSSINNNADNSKKNSAKQQQVCTIFESKKFDRN